MTEMDIEKLRALDAAATAGDLSTVERHTEHEHIECPVCQGIPGPAAVAIQALASGWRPARPKIGDEHEQ